MRMIDRKRCKMLFCMGKRRREMVSFNIDMVKIVEFRMDWGYCKCGLVLRVSGCFLRTASQSISRRL